MYIRFRVQKIIYSIAVFSRNEDKTVQSSRILRNPEQQVLLHTVRLFFPLYTGLLDTWEFQIISIMNLKVQDILLKVFL